MKKITLLVAFVASVLAVSAQNLLVNPSFETWTAGVPNGWTIPANATHAGSLTASQETTILFPESGTSALKLVIGTTQNPGFQQIVPITAGKTYTVYANYYVVSGDGTDVRIWSSFKNGAAFWAAADWTANSALQLKLQGSGSDLAAYFTIASGVWGTYTTEFVAPATATDFVFECRSYKNATVIWDNMVFGEKGSVGINVTKNDSRIFLNGKSLMLSNVALGTSVEVFNSIGKRIQSGVTSSSSYDLSKLAKGMYIVRVGSISKKITL